MSKTEKKLTKAQILKLAKDYGNQKQRWCDFINSLIEKTLKMAFEAYEKIAVVSNGFMRNSYYAIDATHAEIHIGVVKFSQNNGEKGEKFTASIGCYMSAYSPDFWAYPSEEQAESFAALAKVTEADMYNAVYNALKENTRFIQL